MGPFLANIIEREKKRDPYLILFAGETVSPERLDAV
jgi:hypothetical protein